MKNFIAIRKSNRTFNGLMLLTGFTFMLVWLPLLRCLFDGTSYRWGQSVFGIKMASRGMSFDYIYLIGFMALYLLLYYSFYWLKNRSVFYLLLGWWFLHNFGDLLFDIWKNGDTMFHGDTLGVHISLAYIVIPLSILALTLIGFVIKKDRAMQEAAIPWGKINKRNALLILSPIPIQAILFATGEPDDWGDKIGVIAAIIQAILFHRIFIPDKKIESKLS